jgi:hypothetical protein
MSPQEKETVQAYLSGASLSLHNARRIIGNHLDANSLAAFKTLMTAMNATQLTLQAVERVESEKAG